MSNVSRRSGCTQRVKQSFRKIEKLHFLINFCHINHIGTRWGFEIRLNGEVETKLQFFLLKSHQNPVNPSPAVVEQLLILDPAKKLKYCSK